MSVSIYTDASVRRGSGAIAFTVTHPDRRKHLTISEPACGDIADLEILAVIRALSYGRRYHHHGLELFTDARQVVDRHRYLRAHHFPASTEERWVVFDHLASYYRDDLTIHHEPRESTPLSRVVHAAAYHRAGGPLELA